MRIDVLLLVLLALGLASAQYTAGYGTGNLYGAGYGTGSAYGAQTAAQKGLLAQQQDAAAKQAFAAQSSQAAAAQQSQAANAAAVASSNAAAFQKADYNQAVAQQANQEMGTPLLFSSSSALPTPFFHSQC
jgi:hypothetical protein